MDILPHEKQISEYVKAIDYLKKQNQSNPLFNAEIQKMEQKLLSLKKKVYSDLTPWERVLIARHPQRPHSLDCIMNITESFHELHGDRLYGDDQSVVGGIAKIGGKSVVIIGQEKGFDTETRVKRNFGMLSPEGFRKAIRLMRIAEKFSLPIVTLLDTPGAYPGLQAEERGQGSAIAYNLREMARLKTPIIVLLIGEGSSGGALGMGVGDVVGMLEHAYYSVISPEGCASILWKDSSKNKDAAGALKLNAENLLDFGIIDEIIPEPMGGAHQDTAAVYAAIKKFIVEKAAILRSISTEVLLEKRYQKFRTIGRFFYAEEKK